MRPRLTIAAVVLSVVGIGLGAQQASVRSGLDPSTFDRSVRPQDDLYRFVNGRWLDTTPIPADRVSYDTFTLLAERSDAAVREIIESLRAAGPGRQIRGLYASMLDEARLEALGREPIQPDLDRIDAVDSRQALAAEMGRLSSINAGGPFGATTGVDARRAGAIVVTIAQGGTLLPDRDHYLAETPAARALRQQYLRYLETILELSGRPDPRAEAQAVVDLETRLAMAQRPSVAARLRPAVGRFTLDEAMREMPGFDWQAWAAPQGLDRAATLVFENPAFFRAFAREAANAPLAAWRAWLTARMVTATSIFLSSAFADARFEFFGRALSGQEAPIPRWKRGVSLVNGYLGDAVGQLYVQRHFPPSSQRRVNDLTRAVVRAMRAAIDEAAWMSSGAKREARTKLDFLRTKIGFPERWRSYEGLQIRADDLFGNVRRAQQFDNAYRMSRLRRRFEPSHWLLPPQSANAYYSPSRNEIVVPAAILQPPMFDPDADDAVNFGGIGAIIGHEIVHAFDRRGRRFDAHGRASDWWTAGDEAQFVERTRPLIEQYSGYAPLPGAFVNGELTLAENVGDLVGLSAAVRAYRNSLRGEPAPIIDGWTGEQRLFLRWAEIWRARVRDEYARHAVTSTPHAPAQFRALGTVVHLDAFHEAFDIRPGDGLYRPPERRLRIW